MDIMMGMSANVFFVALVQIVAIDIVLGGDNAIDADIVRCKCNGPFAGEGVHGALGGGVPGGLALASGGDLGADVDDGAPVADKFLAAEMGKRIHV